MKAYKHIEDGKKVLKTLISEAKTMDNVKTRLTELNTLITLVNSFEEMLNNTYHTDFFDVLIFSRIYQTLLKSNEEEINLNEFLMYFNQDFRVGAEYIKKDIIDFLRHKQLSNSLKKGEFFRDSDESWSNAIDGLIKQVKSKIMWDKHVNNL